MSQQIDDGERTGIAGEDMRTKQYYAVQLDAHGKIEVAEGATDNVVGILQNKPNTGEAAIYRFAGTSKFSASTSVAIGAWVTTEGAGQAVTTTTDGDITLGRALEAAAAADDLIEVQMNVQHLYV